MGLFEFLMILLSLIIGLGLTEILTGGANLLRARDEVRFYWLHTLFLIGIFFALFLWGLVVAGTFAQRPVRRPTMGPPGFLRQASNATPVSSSETFQSRCAVLVSFAACVLPTFLG